MGALREKRGVRAQQQTHGLAGLCLVSAFLFLSGCNDNPAKPPEENLFAPSPDSLVTLIVESFRQRESRLLEQLLHPEFEFFYEELFLPPLDLPSGQMDRSTFLGQAEYLFSGRPLPGPNGLQPGFSEMDLQLDPLTQWEVQPTEPFADSLRRLFALEMALFRPGESPLILLGELEIIAKNRSFLRGDAEILYWQILGLVWLGAP
jgi:hypothetical protein